MVAPMRAVAIILGFALAAAAHAEPKLERVAFQLTGGCATAQEPLRSALSLAEGVRRADLTLVPGHLVVDIDGALLSAHELTTMVARIMADTGCRAEPMESCITAAPMSRHAGLPPDARGAAH
jgi:hypothetical protein